VCTLHVGYHVFGDTYPRGEFLAALGAELRQAGVSTNGDLPDFLPTVLRLLARLEEPEGRQALRQHALLPALQRMRTALVASQDPWSRLLRALPGALAEEGDVLEEPPSPDAARALSRR
jgi:nitrate reductase delta subunit